MNCELSNGDILQDHSEQQSKKTTSVTFSLDSSVVEELQR
jgi:hypothetical protein